MASGQSRVTVIQILSATWPAIVGLSNDLDATALAPEPVLGQCRYRAVDAAPDRTQISYRRGLPPLATEVLRKITSS